MMIILQLQELLQSISILIQKWKQLTGLGSTDATKVAFKRQRTKIQSAENDRSLFKLPYDSC